MPVFSANYGEYNVAGSFNQFFVNQITAFGVPAWMPSARVVFDWGTESPLISGYSGHAFSVAHLENVNAASYEGKVVDNGSAGEMRRAQVEINCWVSRQIAGNNHIARLRQMRDMVNVLFLKNNWFNIYDVASATANPPSVTARAALDNIDFTNPQADPINPDIFRVRGVAGYFWTERA